jgi:hypothetical protein
MSDDARPTIEETVARLAVAAEHPTFDRVIEVRITDLRTLLESHASMTARVEEAVRWLEEAEPFLSEPLRNDLERGFRHGRLTITEERDRYQATCFVGHTAVTRALAAFVSKNNGAE